MKYKYDYVWFLDTEDSKHFHFRNVFLQSKFHIY